MTAKTKHKAPSLIGIPQSKEMAAATLQTLCQVLASQIELKMQMNSRIEAIKMEHQPEIDRLEMQATLLRGNLQMWCEANRAVLLANGKKTIKFPGTGEVSWRQRPPSVTVRGVEATVQELHQLGLHQFVRSKEEVNKEAILKNPDAVKGVRGITVVAGVEDFIVIHDASDLGA